MIYFIDLIYIDCIYTKCGLKYIININDHLLQSQATKSYFLFPLFYIFNSFTSTTTIELVHIY